MRQSDDKSVRLSKGRDEDNKTRTKGVGEKKKSIVYGSEMRARRKEEGKNGRRKERIRKKKKKKEREGK